MATLAPVRSRPGPMWSPRRNWNKFTTTWTVSLFGLVVVTIFLAPLGYMFLTAFKSQTQILDPYSQFLPASPQTFNYEGKDYPLYEVTTDTGTHTWAMIKKVKGKDEVGNNFYKTTFIDPANLQAGPIETDINGFDTESKVLKPAYDLDPTYENFPGSWAQINLGRLLFNTLFIAIAGTIGTLLSSIAVAYGFSRFRIPGINIIFLILISTIILPRQVTLIPTYVFFRTIGWGGTWWPLIIPHFFANAYNVFLLRQYFKGIPKDLDEAAMIDGATPLQTLLYVIVPQSFPAITAVGLFHFFWAWNDFFEPLVYLSGRPDLETISIGLTRFTNIFGTQPGFAMAASIMTIALPIVIFFLAQRVFMQGIVITGVDK